MFLTAVACVLRNNGVEFYCEWSAWWCHLATWHLVNDCVWNVDTEEPTAPTPRKSSILHVMPCSPEMFVSSVINMTDHPSFFSLCANQGYCRHCWSHQSIAADAWRNSASPINLRRLLLDCVRWKSRKVRGVNFTSTYHLTGLQWVFNHSRNLITWNLDTRRSHVTQPTQALGVERCHC